MSEKRRIVKAVERVQKLHKDGLLPTVKRLSTVEFARNELKSLETHLR